MAASNEVKRNQPGWSLARDSPKPKEKQGWECPAPTVTDWEDYKAWKVQQERKDELPPGTQMYLADFDLLFHQDPDVQLPWSHRLRCELPRRVGRLSRELPVKASYVGVAHPNADERYETFKKVMEEIGIKLCRQIHHPANRFEIAHLEQSDLILVDGGDRKKLWERLGTDLGSNVVPEHVKWRYLCGALVIGVGEAMTLMSQKSWYRMGGDGAHIVPFSGWKIFPHLVASEEEDEDYEDMVKDLGGAGVVILTVCKGGGMVFNRDGLVEPVRQMMTEYRWDWKSESVKRAILIGPPRGTGLICPLYAAIKEREEDDDASADVFSFALSQEEENDEETLYEQFDSHAMWLGEEVKAEVERLKKSGNDAFKAGKADLAGISYQQALTQLRSNRCCWSALEKNTRTFLSSIDPMQTSQEDMPVGKGKKEDHRSASLELSLLLNLSATHLLAFDQDQTKLRKEEQSATMEHTSVSSQEAAQQSQEESDDHHLGLTIVEVRNNLIEAFRAANEALMLAGGKSAKGWFRRGCAFSRMRDPRNAVRDFEEALIRSPGDRSITRHRDEHQELAAKVAENMYYARHKELDKLETRFELEVRRYLMFSGDFCDTYIDERKEFSLAQPLAQDVQGTLQEIDGKPYLNVPCPVEVAHDAPYLHPHALWTWEFIVQRASGMLLLHIENVDLGSGPLEWVCKGLRTHSQVRVLRFIGVHLGAAGAKMMRNVLGQSASLTDVCLDGCALHDAGLDEIAEGLRDNAGQLEVVSLRRNYFTHKKIGKLTQVFAEEDNHIGISQLDLSENSIGIQGAKEIGKLIGSDHHRLRNLVLQDAYIDLAAFWRLVNNLSDQRCLSKLDLRCNPIGRGTRRVWRSTMGPSIRCEVLLSDKPLKAKKEKQVPMSCDDRRSYPLPSFWV